MAKSREPVDLASWKTRIFDRGVQSAGDLAETIDAIQRKRLKRFCAALADNAQEESLLLAYLLAEEGSADVLADFLEDGDLAYRASRVRAVGKE